MNKYRLEFKVRNVKQVVEDKTLTAILNRLPDPATLKDAKLFKNASDADNARDSLIEDYSWPHQVIDALETWGVDWDSLHESVAQGKGYYYDTQWENVEDLYS